MFAISIDENNFVRDVYNTELYVDDNVTLYEITEEQKDAIWFSGNHGLWKFVDGVLIKVEIVEPEVSVVNDL